MILYFFIALAATVIGAMTGLGGGVIIKPLLDFLGNYNLPTIGVLSSFTVFSMALVSIIKQIRYKVKIELRKTAFIGIGSIAGGVLGNKIVNILLMFLSEALVTIIQSLTLAILLIIIYIYMNNKEKFKSYKVSNSIACILIGILLGSLASFLSIGGGPINVCVLAFFFSMNTKEAAINSIITILFSQGSKLFTAITTQGLKPFDLTMLPYMIIGGIVGGIIGASLNKKFNSEVILKVFNIVLIALILLNIYNVIGILII